LSFWRRRRRVDIGDNRIEALLRANDLLVELRKVSVSLPQEFDLDNVLDRGHESLSGLSAGAIATILLLDNDIAALTPSFVTVRGRGSHQKRRLSVDQLPGSALSALDSRHSTSARLTGDGVATEAAFGVYSALRSRGRVIGLVSVEFRNEDHGSEIESVVPQLVTGLSDALAVAVDNARLLSEMRRRVEADERRRIARDLHDRTGSTLAAIGFEIDRLMTKSSDQTASELRRIRGEISSAITALRDTLVDLRTDATEDELSTGLKEFAAQVSVRSGITITNDICPVAPVPVDIAKQFLVIAKEAVINVERHARADAASISLTRRGDTVELSVTDNGRGFDPTRIPTDRYGIRGMAERAESIGSRLDIVADASGTTVRLIWDSSGAIRA